MNQNEPDFKRIFWTMLMAAVLLMVWQAFVEWPRRQALGQYHAQKIVEQQHEKEKQIASFATKDSDPESNPNLDRKGRLALSPRLAIRSNNVHGSVALKGLRFDDLTLAKYRETLEPESPEVVLFSPNGDEKSYFAQIGWLSQDGTKVPDKDSVWQTNSKQLITGEPVQLRWNNGSGVTFIVSIALDNAYMFDVQQKVENKSGKAISIMPYAFINRAFEIPKHHAVISHEGPIGVLLGALDEIPYSDLKDTGEKTYDDAKGWLGITDKYWLSALVPSDPSFKASFSYYNKSGKDRYQVDYLNDPITLDEGESKTTTLRLFAGAKEIDVLDYYAKGDEVSNSAPIPLFDRAVDFGVLYFLTKPLFLTLNYFYSHIGNFGVAILLLTIVVKLVLYPLANKSYKATSRIRELQPELTKIREKYGDDPMAMQKETLALYKKEKVNPASGCLPLLIQMPIFFALYKVLYVTIEMRHAPFFGWLKDLSAADPTNIFTLFGLIDWNPPTMLHIGVLPILYCISMVIQMRQQPKPTDPVQAKMMKFMPYFLLVVMAQFSAGLILYWIWSNILSIAQQEFISRRHKKPRASKKRAASHSHE
ncbi:MAG: membrane protein insertase YidC [Rickettsiales bacterium]|nr:membrane protein insertase YidC [Rickettsiales bacterium]